MTIDLNDPESVAAWYRINPERHGPQLRGMALMWPQFRAALAQAWKLVR